MPGADSFVSGYRRRKHRRQRAQRGWSVYDWWCGDDFILSVIADMAEAYKTQGVGYPCNTSEEEWAADLDKIIGPLRAYTTKQYDVTGDEAQEMWEQASIALHWFADNFSSFWD